MRYVQALGACVALAAVYIAVLSALGLKYGGAIGSAVLVVAVAFVWRKMTRTKDRLADANLPVKR